MKTQVTMSEDDLTKAFEYLDSLRVSGRTNMWAGNLFLARETSVTQEEADWAHLKWIEVYDRKTPARDLARKVLAN